MVRDASKARLLTMRVCYLAAKCLILRSRVAASRRMTTRAARDLRRLEMAGRPLVACGRPQLRLLDTATIKDEGAAGMEAASLRRIDRARHIALEDDRILRSAGLGHRHGREQRLGVGMPGCGEDLPL